MCAFAVDPGSPTPPTPAAPSPAALPAREEEGPRRPEQREEGVERGAADGGGRRRFASAVGETTVWVVTLCVSRDPNMGMGLLFG